MKTVPTLYEWAGRQAALERLTKRFYEHVATDTLLSPVFAHMSANHALHVAHFIGEMFGGPQSYTHDGGGSHAATVARYIGKMLDEPRRQRWMALLLQTADEVGLPDHPESRSALVAYLEWGSRIAVVNSTTTDNTVKPQVSTAIDSAQDINRR